MLSTTTACSIAYSAFSPFNKETKHVNGTSQDKTESPMQIGPTASPDFRTNTMST
jgi:hypothetical protein